MPCGTSLLPTGILALPEEGAAHLPGITREEQLLPILSTAISYLPLARGKGTQNRVIHPKSCPKDLAEAAFEQPAPFFLPHRLWIHCHTLILLFHNSGGPQILGPEPLR